MKLVGEFGVGVLRHEQKTPFLQYVLYCERHNITNIAEYKLRQAQSTLSEDRIRELVYSLTGSRDEADKAAGYLTLQRAKEEAGKK